MHAHIRHRARHTVGPQLSGHLSPRTDTFFPTLTCKGSLSAYNPFPPIQAVLGPHVPLISPAKRVSDTMLSSQRNTNQGST